MKRTIRKMLVTLTIAGTVAVSSLGAAAAEMNVSVDNTQESVARFMHTYTETITVDYPSASSVPSTYYYEYYSSSMKIWYRGTLKFVSYVTNKNGGVTATFSGTMYGQNM